MFNSTARRVKEMRPTIDLFEVLRQKSPDAYDRLMAGLNERPDEVDDGDEETPLFASLEE